MNIVAEPCKRLINKPPRGVACIQCLHPSARTQSRAIVNTLYKSCLRRPAINFLVDTTFAGKENYSRQLKHLARITLKLTLNGRKPHIIFYLTSGPTQRRPIAWGLSRFSVNPLDFRKALRNGRLKPTYARYIRRLLPLIQALSDRGATVYLIHLEDNLSNADFRKLTQLTFDLLPPELANVRLGRNPCPGCFPGNGSEIPPGVVPELHTSSARFKLKNGIVTNDGFVISSKTATAIMRRSAELGNVFLYWDAENQGIRSLESYKLPNDREYPVPTKEEQWQTIEFLKQ